MQQDRTARRARYGDRHRRLTLGAQLNALYCRTVREGSLSSTTRSAHSLTPLSSRVWKHCRNSATYLWSGDAVRYLVDLPDDPQDEVIRREYREQRRAKKAAAQG